MNLTIIISYWGVEVLMDSMSEVKTVLKRFYPDYKDEEENSED